jgi:hypothetical protein
VFEANLRRLFPDLEALPHQNTLARLLARIDVAEIEQAHLDMIRQLIRNKQFRRYLIGGCYPIAIDGTQKFTRAQCWDAACLERKVGSKKTPDPPPAEPEKQYYVYVLEANLAFQNGMVIPLLSEVLSDTQGPSPKDKQDCEQRAFQRLAQRLKEGFSHLPILLLLDGLYANGPIIALCRQYNWDFMIVLQDGSLPTVWEEIQGLQKLERAPTWTQKWGDRRQSFQWFNQNEHCFAYAWEPLRGYHYLMRVGHALNVLARYSRGLAKYVRDLGVRGLIDFVRQTIANPWLKLEQLQQIATAPCQIRLE